MMEKYLKIPYKAGGRAESGCDCWGFVCLIIKEEKGINLPSYGGIDETETDGLEASYTRLQSPEDWAIVLMQQRKGHAHVGIYLRGKILHMTHSGACFVPASRLQQYEVKGYYSVQSKDSREHI